VEYYGDDGNTTDAAFAHIIKKISDQHGRVIQFELDRTKKVVNRIIVPAPATNTGSPRVGDYLFDYDTVDISGLFAAVGGGAVTHQARVLKSLSGPNLSSSGNERYVHQFEYHAASTERGGRLWKVIYPSGKVTVISYAYYPFLTGTSSGCTGIGGSSHSSLGVSMIETFLDGDTSNTAPTNPLYRKTVFSQSTYPLPLYTPVGSANCDYYPFDQLNAMVDAAGNKTEFRYKTPAEDYLMEWYGQLMGEKYFLGSTTAPKLVKTLEYDYEKLDEHLFALDDSDYEMVAKQIITTWSDDHVVDTTTPVSTVMQEYRSNFDGFGHYQRSELSGNAIGAKGKVVIKDYASDNTGVLCHASDLQENWLGDVVAREEVWEKGTSETIVSRSVYGYDTARGLRTSEVRKVDPAVAAEPCTSTPSPDTDDYVTIYTFTDAGDLASERHYVPGISSTSTPGDVTTTYTYFKGAEESAKQSALSYYDYFRTIDPDTGLVTAEKSVPTSSTDTTAVSTSFEYDVLGRTTKIKHGTDDAIALSYVNEASGTAPSVRLLKVVSTQGTGMTQTEAVDWFKYGRLDKEEKLNPDSSRAYRYTTYDRVGRVYFVSNWTRQSTITGVPGTTTDHTVYNLPSGAPLGQDPFGRVTVLTDPLGNVTDYEYFGLNKRVWSHNVALKSGTLGAVWDVWTAYYTDALGRLRVVSEPWANSSTTIDQAAAGVYSYDVLGRLVKAQLGTGATLSAADPADRYSATMTVPTGMNGPQSRTFTYDKLGRLTESLTPENFTINSAWNALGQVTESRDGNSTSHGYKHRTTYDGAGRPTKLERIVTGFPTSDEVWSPGTSEWTASGWSLSNCMGPTSWYIGDTNCRYAQSGPINATLTSSALARGTILTFKYRREVRGDAQAAGSRDRLRVLIADTADPEGWYELWNLDSTQVSWDKWVQSPAIDLSQVQLPEGYQFKIRFEFNSVDPNTTPNLKGIGISQIELKRPAAVILQETFYDETFNYTGNKPRGKPTRLRDYDEATGLPIFTRELHYIDANGRLSDEVLSFDWDRDGVNESLGDSYYYDSRGDLSAQVMPHPQGLPARRYDYWRWHGAVTAISATDQATNAVQTVVPSGIGDGIQYNDAGGMSAVRFANGLQQHIDSNPDFLPSRIWVAPEAGGAPIFDTGQYLYDGARNIKQIGPDYFRYDAAMRLTWEKINTSRQGVVELDQSYDVFGNMRSQSAIQTGSVTDALPQGMAFSGRNFIFNAVNENRIVNTGFDYDASGNLKDEPAHDGLLTPVRYGFSIENQLARITEGPYSGKVLQSGLYEGGEHRWLRSIWADGGKALITLRDASGQVVADFLESSGASGLQLQKEYVHANGQLVAINSTCGLRPALNFSGTASGLVWFDRTDFGLAAVGSYTVYISTDSGQTKSLSLPSSTPPHFSIAQTEFFVGVTNQIQVETDAACGHTGYSNTVSYSYSVPAGPPTVGNCLTAISGSRYGFSGSGSNVKILAGGDECPSGTTYNVYYVDPNAEATELVPLNAVPLSTPMQVLANMPCGSGEGNYWIRSISPVTHHEVGSSPMITMDGTNCGGVGNGLYAVPGQPAMNAQFVHWDHLGSTRMLTDEHSVPLAAFKYYPFGMEAESTGGDEMRQKFTGHERDDGVGLDYMMARSCKMALARFLQPDEYGGSMRPALPQSWNRYAYVLNNPVNATDPEGYVENNNAAYDPRHPSAVSDPAPPPGKQADNAIYVDFNKGAKGAVVVEYGAAGGLSLTFKVGKGDVKAGADAGVTTTKDVLDGTSTTTRDLTVGGSVSLGSTDVGLRSETHITTSVNGQPVQGEVPVSTAGTVVGVERRGGSANLSEGPTVAASFTAGVVRGAINVNVPRLAVTLAKSPIVMHNILRGRGVQSTASAVQQQRAP
jgi:RHS repeat-associated protein